MECMEALDNGNKALWFMCVRWSTGGEVNPPLGTRADSKTDKRLRVEELFGADLFDSTEGLGSVVCSYPVLEPFTKSFVVLTSASM